MRGRVLFLTCALALVAGAETWYVPGWLRCHGHAGEAVERVRQALPDESVVYCDWDGNRGWGRSATNAERHVETLVAQIAALDVSVRTNLTLVGHSLGGRIAVRALARLGERGLVVRRAFVLGAAMPCDDPDIAKAGTAARESVWMLSNPSDIVLRYIYRAAPGIHASALGLAGPAGRPFNCRSVVVPDGITEATEVKGGWGRVESFKKIAAHYAVFYLAHMKKILSEEQQ